MERTRFIEHNGRRIVLVDLSGLGKEEESLAEIEKARRFFATQQPNGSLLTVTDGTGAHYTTRIMDALKKLAAHNKPYVKAACAVTDTRLHRVVITAVAIFTGRHLPVFASREEALRWLDGQ